MVCLYVTVRRVGGGLVGSCSGIGWSRGSLGVWRAVNVGVGRISVERWALGGWWV